MKQNKFVRKFFSVFFAFIFFIPFFTHGETVDDIKNIINEKTSTLRELEAQRQALQNQLNAINKSSSKLSDELNYYNNSIHQLDLLIRSNKLTIEKLELEIHSLQNEIQMTQEDIENKKQTIGKLFVELQEQDNQNLLSIFLKNESLAEIVRQKKTISDLNNNLLVNINELYQLQKELGKKIDEQRDRKYQKTLESENMANRQYILNDQKKEKQILLTQTKNQERIYEQQINELRKMQDEIASEIENMENILRKNINQNLLPLPRRGVLAWPVPGGVLTQAYGYTAFAAKTYKSKYHNGYDIGKYIGAEIVSAEDGVVINMGNQDLYCKGGAYGKYIVIKHTNGLTTLYGHLSRQIVKVGQEVKRGEIIGYMGHTGWATGPHLHFTVFASNTISPARPGLPEGTQQSRSCGPMPVGGDLDPGQYLEIPS